MADVPISPMADPQMAKFMQLSGYADAEAVASGQYKIAMNNAALTGKQTSYADQDAAEQQSIQQDTEGRGVSQSSERINAQNQAHNTLAHKQAADQNDTAMQNQNIYLEIARQLAESQRNVQQESLASIARTTTGNANGTLAPYL